MGISAVLIVKNEEKNIAACLGALKFADEIVVVDSGSSDRTAELARMLATKTVSRPFDNFAAQKNFAVSLATQDWILSIDADERVSDKLREEIRQTVLRTGGADAYKITRRTNFFGRDFVASGLQDDAPIRLFRRGKTVFQNPVHEIVVVDGKTGRLHEKLDHRSFQTIHEHLDKLQLYTGVEARNSEKVKVWFWSCFFLRPIHRFLSIYVLRQGYRDGIEGYLYASLSAYYEWVRWMKRWERDSGR